MFSSDQISYWLSYGAVFLLFLVNALGFVLNFAGIPGNWLIVLATGVYCWIYRGDELQTVGWPAILFLLLLAVLSEVIEFVAGTAGAAQSGASRRSMVLSVVGSIIGSLLGVIIGLPIPIVGSAVAALIGGALGAAGGATLGDQWKGRDLEGSMQVGVAAFWGRILGTVGKLIVGGMMLVFATVDSIW